MKNTQQFYLGIILVLLVIIAALVTKLPREQKIVYSPANEEVQLFVSNEAATSTPSINSPVTAYIAGINESQITLDYVDVLSGEEAKKTKVADGLCLRNEVEGCFPNGEIYDRNVNPQLRTFTMASGIEILEIGNNPTGSEGSSPISVDALKMKPERTLYEISFNKAGMVSSIREVYRP